MIEEGISKIARLVENQHEATVITIPGESPHVVRLQLRDGSIDTIELKPPDRRIWMTSIDDLVDLAVQHFDASVKDNDRQLITFTQNEIVLHFDYTLGRECAYLPLTPTKEFTFFESCHRGNGQLEVKQLRTALRYDLRKCFDDPNLVAQVSSLSTTGLDNKQANADRGRESLGRQISAQVDNPDKMPDELQEFAVRRYSNPELDVRYQLQCILDPDAATSRWILKPIEDSYTAFIDKTMELVRTKLTQDNPVRVLAGCFVGQGAGMAEKPMNITATLDASKFGDVVGGGM